MKQYRFDGNLINLKKQVCAETGIPEKCQRYIYKRSILTENNISAILDGSIVMLSLALKGGAKNCEICFDSGTHICRDCHSKIFCSDCCIKFHKHPSRSSHNPEIISEKSFSSVQDLSQPTLDANNIDFTAQETSLNSWDDEITDSPNTSAAFEEASMIMTWLKSLVLQNSEITKRRLLRLYVLEVTV